MTPDRFYRHIVVPGLAFLADVTGIPSTPEARCILMAIAGQESAWGHREQIGGPARGWWQFERGGGVRGVATHPATMAKLRAVAAELNIPADVDSVYEMLAHNDHLAVAVARLLLFTDPDRLPAIGLESTAWEMYQRNWRPGKPHPQAWPVRYAEAMRQVGA